MSSLDSIDGDDYHDGADLKQRKMNVELSSDNALNKAKSAEVEMMPLAHMPLAHSDSDVVDHYEDEPFDGSMEKEGMDFAHVQEPSCLPEWLDHFLYPPSLPRTCQLLRVENIAVPACYLLVGLLLGLSSPLINAYPLDLGASEAQQTSISAIRSLPASFKLIFGFLSDSKPLMGYRRKSYMMVGWMLCGGSYLLLFLGSNLNMQLGERGCSAKSQVDQQEAIPPDDAPSMPFLSFCALMAETGMWFADVMGDSIVAEKAKLEPPDQRGSIQVEYNDVVVAETSFFQVPNISCSFFLDDLSLL